MGQPYKSALTCQIIAEHFSHSDWHKLIQRSALDYISGRTVQVAEFVPESLLFNTSFVVRPANLEEYGPLRSPHRLFKLFIIECHSLECDEIAILDGYGADFDGLSDQEKLSFYIDMQLRSFCVAYLSMINLATFGCFSPFKLSSSRHVSDEFEREQLISLQDLDYHISDYIESEIEIPGAIDEFLQWSKGCAGVWGGSAKTNVEKAFSFLLNCVHHDEGRSEISKLAWGVAALEALAADSNQEIRAKIIRRIPKIFDCLKMKDPRKFLGVAYDFRSRLFHGDLPIFNKVTYPEGPPPDIKDVDSDCHEYGMTICAIVISIIWRCVKNKSYEVEFFEEVRFK